MMKRLKLEDYVPDGKFFHFTYCTFPKPWPRVSHAHDFIEIFWTVEGSGIHHCNSRDLRFRPGDLVVITPADAHMLWAIGNQKWTIANLSFATGILEDLTLRYPQITERVLARDEHGDPCSHSLSGVDGRALDQLERELQDFPQSRFVLDRFLINLFGLIGLHGHAESHDPAMPDWLAHAVKEIQRPLHFQDGMRGFVRLAGHSQAHVIRETRKWLGNTPGELIHAAQLHHAHRLLATSKQSLKEIRNECGFKSSSHFHRSFQARFHQTPRQFRINQQSIATATKGC